LSRLIQEIWFCNSACVVREFRGSCELPPNCRLVTPACVPSVNVEFTRTLADGRFAYGSPVCTLCCSEALVSSRKLSWKYAE